MGLRPPGNNCGVVKMRLPNRIDCAVPDPCERYPLTYVGRKFLGIEWQGRCTAGGLTVRADLFRKFQSPPHSFYGVIDLPLYPIEIKKENKTNTWGFMLLDVDSSTTLIFRGNAQGGTVGQMVFQAVSFDWGTRNLSCFPERIYFNSLDQQYLPTCMRYNAANNRYEITITYPKKKGCPPARKNVPLHAGNQWLGLWSVELGTDNLEIDRLIAVHGREEYHNAMKRPRGQTGDLFANAGVLG